MQCCIVFAKRVVDIITTKRKNRNEKHGPPEGFAVDKVCSIDCDDGFQECILISKHVK
jgi:hypothetical protein